MYEILEQTIGTHVGNSEFVESQSGKHTKVVVVFFKDEDNERTETWYIDSVNQEEIEKEICCIAENL